MKTNHASHPVLSACMENLQFSDLSPELNQLFHYYLQLVNLQTNIQKCLESHPIIDVNEMSDFFVEEYMLYTCAICSVLTSSISVELGNQIGGINHER